MKKILSIFTLIICLSTFVKANNNNDKYYLDESSIEDSFNQSEDITSQYMLMLSSGVFNQLGSNEKLGDDNKQLTAGIIAIASFFVRWGSGIIAWIPYVGFFTWIGVSILAIVPWHRIYLKAGGQEFKNVALYCVTLGWCINAHHVVDGIFLLLDDSKSKYINNPKYVMWAN
jgi:hypothetical protein